VEPKSKPVPPTAESAVTAKTRSKVTLGKTPSKAEGNVPCVRTMLNLLLVYLKTIKKRFFYLACTVARFEYSDMPFELKAHMR
jgi:hypothetical protein